MLAEHVSAVPDFTDAAAVASLHSGEIMNLLLTETGADEVLVSALGILRFSERSDRAGLLGCVSAMRAALRAYHADHARNH